MWFPGTPMFIETSCWRPCPSTSAKGYHGRWQSFAFETRSFKAEWVNIWHISLYTSLYCLYLLCNCEFLKKVVGITLLGGGFKFLLFSLLPTNISLNGLKPPTSLVQIAKRQARWGWIGHACQLLDLFGHRWSSTSAILQSLVLFFIRTRMPLIYNYINPEEFL